jgi:glycosyltransferase involved in cell wall biosynthesis
VPYGDRVFGWSGAGGYALPVMSRPPEFTVIVPTYDRAEFLGEAIGSLRGQTFGDFECIVVDDASPTSVTVPSDPRIRLLRRDANGGCAAARNTGLRAARGRFVAFLDDDDIYTPDRLAMVREALQDAQVVVCWRQGANGAPRPERPLQGDVSDAILDRMTPSPGQVTVARSVAPLFDERFPAVEDVDWLLRLARRASFATVPRVGYVVRQHAGARPHHGIEARLLASRQLLENHAPYFAGHPVAAAFRWKRIGLLAAQLGRTAEARRAFWRSFRLHPQAATLWHLVRQVGVRGDHEGER